MRITADNVTIEDLTVTNSSDIGENAGVRCSGINAMLIRVEASGNGQYGVSFWNGRNIFLSDCTIEDNGAFGLNLHGIMIWVTTFTISECTIMNSAGMGSS